MPSIEAMLWRERALKERDKAGIAAVCPCHYKPISRSKPDDPDYCPDMTVEEGEIQRAHGLEGLHFTTVNHKDFNAKD